MYYILLNNACVFQILCGGPKRKVFYISITCQYNVTQMKPESEGQISERKKYIYINHQRQRIIPLLITNLFNETFFIVFL